MVFCNQCGTQLNEGAKFCGKCGNAVGSVFNEHIKPVPQQQSIIYETGKRKTRHGFTSFWLWLCFIFYSITVIVVAVDFLFLDGEIMSGIFPFIALWRIGLIYLAGAVGLFMLIKWQKFGFNLLCISWVFYLTRDGLARGIQGVIQELIFAVIFIGILFGVLQLKNANNESAWKLLRE